MNSTLFNNSAFVHPHWQTFFHSGDLPASHWVHVATALYISCVGIFGAVGNGILFWIFASCQSLRSPSNLLVINLAVADFALCVGAFPMMAASSIAEHWLFAQPGCTFYGFWAGICGMVSINSMAGIAIDRCCAITKWTRWQLTFTLCRNLIILIWLFALGLVVPPLFGWSHYILESLQTSCTFDYLSRTPADISFTMYLFGVGFLVPVLIILLCYGFILVHIARHRSSKSRLRTHRSARASRPNSYGDKQTSKCQLTTITSLLLSWLESHARVSTGDKKELNVRASATCVLLVTFFCLAWTPYAVVSLVGIFGDQSYIKPVLTSVTVLLAKSNVINNPIIYALMNDRFRRALARKLRRRDHSSTRHGLHGNPHDCVWPVQARYHQAGRWSSSKSSKSDPPPLAAPDAQCVSPIMCETARFVNEPLRVKTV